MAFVTDSFTDTDGTLLTAHTGETGATWTALIGTSPDIASNSAHPNGSGEAVAYASGVPASAEYDVEGVFVGSPSASYGMGMAGRIDTGVATGTYYLQWNSTTAYILYKVIAGSFTNIGSYTSTPTAGDTLKLEIRNAAKKIFLNGTERISSTTNDITGAGRVGFRSYGNNTAVGIDTLSATDASGGATGTLATTNANDTSAASGSTTVIGALAKSNVDDTSAASGTTTVLGTLATTNANDTSAASGTTTVSGTLATTNASDTSNASGSVGNDITGTVATTNANDTSAAAGTTTVTGSLAKSNIDDTSAASGTTTVLGAVAYTNINDFVAASGYAAPVSGTVAYTNSNDTSAASGTGSNNTSGGYLVETLSEKRRLRRHLEEAQEVVQRIKKPSVSQDDAEALQEDAAEISKQLKASIAELEAVAESYQKQLDQKASFKAFAARQEAKEQARQIQALMIDAQLHAEIAQQQIEELDVVFMAFALMAYV